MFRDIIISPKIITSFNHYLKVGDIELFKFKDGELFLNPNLNVIGSVDYDFIIDSDDEFAMIGVSDYFLFKGFPAYKIVKLKKLFNVFVLMKNQQKKSFYS